MDGYHDAGLNASELVKSLGHRSEAVGGAGSCGNNLIILGEGVLVNAEDDGLHLLSGRSGNNNLLGTCIDVSECKRTAVGIILYIEAGALENYVDVELAPRKVLGILLSVDLDLVSVNGDGILAGGNGVLVLADVAAVAALSSIILQEVSKHSRLGQIVDSNDIIALSTEHLTESETTDTAESINRNSYSHFSPYVTISKVRWDLPETSFIIRTFLRVLKTLIIRFLKIFGHFSVNLI